MKKQIKLFALLLCLCSIGFSQSFNPFPGKWDYSYLEPDDYLHVIRVDSTDTIGGNVHSYFNFLIRPDTTPFTDCFGGTFQGFRIGPNLFGSEMIDYGSGTYAFIHQSDTFKLETTTTPGMKWEFNPATGDSAWIDSLYVASILDTTDTIIDIQTSGGKTLSISQNHGITQAVALFPLYLSEEWAPNFMARTVDTLSLLGIKELNIGRSYPGFEGVYDHDIGDKFSTDRWAWTLSYDYGSGNYYEFEVQGIDTTTAPGTIDYDVFYRNTNRHRTDPYSGLVTDPPTTGTTTMSINRSDHAGLDYLPSSFPDTTAAHSMSIAYLSSARINPTMYDRIEIEVKDIYDLSYDTCANAWRGSIIWLGGSEKKYGEGVGMTTDLLSSWDEGHSYELKCYIKGTEVWPIGDTCLALEREDLIKDEKTVHIYPNPATDKLIIESVNIKEGPMEIDIYTSTGQLVKLNSIRSTGTTHSIDVSNLSPGIYFMNIRMDKQPFHQQKFIKH